jgi:hypothetical protein
MLLQELACVCKACSRFSGYSPGSPGEFLCICIYPKSVDKWTGSEEAIVIHLRSRK